MKTVAVVPAKGSSERIKNKNLSILDGEYLFKRKLRQLLDCQEIDEVWIDSENETIHNLCNDLPIKHLYRDKNFASNETDGHSLFAYEADKIDFDILVQVLCTSPFLDAKTIDKALQELKQSTKTSLITIQKTKNYKWRDSRPLYGERIPNSIDLEHDIFECMNFYAVKKTSEKITKRYTEDPILFELNPLEAFDINFPIDLEIAELISLGFRSKISNHFNALSKIISSGMLSDILKEKNIPHFISDNMNLLPDKKFLGFAKTLKLKELDNKDNWTGIFDALHSYDFIRPGDVIVVSTDVPDRAYFGDLNATIANRSGAVGVVIDGVTRDYEKVLQIGIPVCAKGKKSNDIRFEGTLEDMNMPITINGVNIKNNDIIFGDSDGVIRIPSECWDEIQKELKLIIQKEVNVKIEASFGTNSFEILNKIGSF